jgi:tRNA1Val (adenine37-N6)-methyltransferase
VFTHSGEKLIPLGGGISAIVSGGITFGEDAVLLADFSLPYLSARGRQCDLGTGCGIIPLLWCRGRPGISADAVELDPDAAGLARRAAQLSGAGIRVHLLDLRHLPPDFHGAFSLVTCNPPYFPAGAGSAGARAAARHETSCTIADAASAASGMLKNSGRFCLCHRPERLADVICALRAAGLEPKKLRMVSHSEGRAPWLMLIESVKNAGPGLEVLPQLVMTCGGKPTAEAAKIYGDYGA